MGVEAGAKLRMLATLGVEPVLFDYHAGEFSDRPVSAAGSLDELRANWQEDRRWTPQMDAGERDRLLRNWKKAVTKTFDWVEQEES